MAEHDPFYNSGGDFLLEYGELKMTFSTLDFCERVEQAAKRLEFIHPDAILSNEELEDLLNYFTDGEIEPAVSPLGDHLREVLLDDLAAGDRKDGSLVHWLRRIVFREAWFDKKVKEGDFDVRFDPETSDFVRVDRASGNDIIPKDVPSWSHALYGPDIE